MSLTLSQFGIDRLDAQQRVELIGLIWDSLPDDAPYAPPTGTSKNWSGESQPPTPTQKPASLGRRCGRDCRRVHERARRPTPGSQKGHRRGDWLFRRTPTWIGADLLDSSSRGSASGFRDARGSWRRLAECTCCATAAVRLCCLVPCPRRSCGGVGRDPGQS